MHPQHLVDEGDRLVVELWSLWRGGDLGRGPLPFAGGSAEQPAWIMDAFAICGAAAKALRPDQD